MEYVPENKVDPERRVPMEKESSKIRRLEKEKKSL